MKKYVALGLAVILSLSPAQEIWAREDNSSPALLKELQILDKDGNDQAKLAAPLTRGEGLAMVLKAMGYSQQDVDQAENISLNRFTDIPKWLFGYAGLAKKLNITNGRTAEIFAPYEPITKKELLTFLLRALGYGSAETWTKTAELGVKAGLMTAAEKLDEKISKGGSTEFVVKALAAELQNTDLKECLAERLVRQGKIGKEKLKILGIEPAAAPQPETKLQETTSSSLMPLPDLPAVPEDEDFQAVLNGRGFKTAVDLGVAASTAVAPSAVFGTYQGRTYAYSTAVGGRLNVIDVEDNALVYSQQLGEVGHVWTHTVGADGKVYISGLDKNYQGELWIYDPAVKKANRIGVLLPRHQAWSSITDEAGNLYVGTFREGEGHVVKYEADTGRIIDLGEPDPEGDSSYVRSIAYYDRALYLGMGVTAKILRMDLGTGQVENISEEVLKEVKEPISDVKMVPDMAVVGEYLLVRVDTDNEDALLFYHLPTQQWKKVLKKPAGSGTFGVFGFNQLVEDGDNTYVTYNRQILKINYQTLESESTGIAFPAALRGAYLHQSGGRKYLLTMARQGNVCWFDLEGQELTRKPVVMVAAPLPLHNLGLGNNGKLYLSTYPGGPKGSEFNPLTGTYRVYNQGQAEGIVAGSGDIQYFGIYPGAKIQAMDTSTGEFTELFNLSEGYEQDRPYIMKYDDGKLLIGTIPDYQKLGGALAIYDPVSGEKEVYRNIVENQSIVGLALKDGLIYGSTSIFGGLGGDPAATEPKLFIWDVAAKEKIAEMSLQIPGLKAKLISGLTFDEAGNLWGTADGVLFIFDTLQRKVVRYRNIYPEVSGRGRWRPTNLVFGRDGLLYTNLGGKMTVVDPKDENWKHITLDLNADSTVSQFQLTYDSAGNQNIYWIEDENTEFKMIPVRPTGQPDKIPNQQSNPEPEPTPDENELLKNGSFEEGMQGWKLSVQNDPSTSSYEITEEKAKRGQKSLKIVDVSTSAACYVESDLMTVEAGKDYVLELALYVDAAAPKPGAPSRAVYMVWYYDQNGKWLLEKQGLLNPGKSRWEEIQMETKAPEGAVSAKLLLGTSPLWMTSGAYFDSVSFRAK